MLLKRKSKLNALLVFSMLFLTFFVAQTQMAEAVADKPRIYWTSVDPNWKWDSNPFDYYNEYKYFLHYTDAGGTERFEWSDGGYFQVRYSNGKTSVFTTPSYSKTNYGVDPGDTVQIKFYEDDPIISQPVSGYLNMVVPSGSIPNLYTFTGWNGDKHWVTIYKS